MKNILLAIGFSFALSSCAVVATVQKYWPRDHDPVMFETLVVIEQELDAIDCKNPNWSKVQYEAKKLDRYATLRDDPQRENLQGLNKHIEKLSSNKNPVFCDLGKKTGKQRIEAALNAWKGR
jgi:hypothetical protein